MALTYSSLKTSIQAWGWDESTELSSVLGDIINFAELRLSRDLYVTAFNTQSVGTFTGTALTNGLFTIPADLVAVNYFTVSISGNSYTLQRKTLEYVKEVFPNAGDTDEPRFYAEYDDTRLLIAPTPDSGYSYEIGYKRRLPALSDGNPTNWLTENASDALLAACIAEAARFKQDADLMGIWEARYQTAVVGVNAEQSRTQRDNFVVVNVPTAEPNG